MYNPIYICKYIYRTPYKPPNKAEGIGGEVQAKNCGRSEGDTF